MTAISTTMSLDEIDEAGLEALYRELGPAGMVRFIHQFDKGSGDYTAERARLQAGTTIEDVMAAIRKVRAERERAPRPLVRERESTTIGSNASEDEIRGIGLEALRRELGSAFVLFLRLLIKPSSDSAAARAKLAGYLTADEIADVLERRREAQEDRNPST